MSWSSPVVPVVTVASVEDGVTVARALRDGGLPVIEVTLRSPAALDAIAAIRAEVPETLCGVGTLVTPADVKAAVDAGAQFLVSPGTTPVLLDAMLATGLTALPGAATVSEGMVLLEAGVTTAKFFPAEASGGTAALRAFAGPLPGLTWCATGGIDAATAPSYLALPNVVAVGGSWMVPAGADEQTVRRLAAEAAQLTG